MWRAGDSGEDQLEQQTMPVSNSETLLEGTAGWKKMEVSPLPLLEDFYDFQWVKQTVLLNSYPLAKDRYQGFLLLKTISWLNEHWHAMSHTVMYSCPQSSSSPYAPLPAVSSYTGWARGGWAPQCTLQQMWNSLCSQHRTSGWFCKQQKAEFKGLFLLHSSLSVE